VEKNEPVFTLGLHACPAVDVTFPASMPSYWRRKYGASIFEKVSPEMNAATAAMNAGIIRGAF